MGIQQIISVIALILAVVCVILAVTEVVKRNFDGIVRWLIGAVVCAAVYFLL